MDISGSSVLVTGAASGLGAATAARFAAAGAQVFGLDLAPSIDKAAPAGGVTLIPTDVTDEAQVQSAIDTIAAAGAPLRVAVNCAGVGWASRILTKDGPHDLDLFRKIVDINLVGTFNVMRLAANQMKDEPEVDADGARGVIVNTASEFQKTLAEAIPFPHRLGEAAEYAELAEFIVTHNYLNGETIRMDGALRMAPR